ncbi:MAG: hypothetical protein KDH96_04040 [Candidatus Riesia sp.]|nr:hypothetical protein [Candidatus Riesia sp.]
MKDCSGPRDHRVDKLYTLLAETQKDVDFSRSSDRLDLVEKIKSRLGMELKLELFEMENGIKLLALSETNAFFVFWRAVEHIEPRWSLMNWYDPTEYA